MAKSGRMVNPGEEGSSPNIVTEQTAPPNQAAMPVETTPDANAKAGTAVQVQEKPIEVAPQAAPPKVETPPAQPLDWKEVLKQQPVAEVLKTLGLDETTAKFLEGKKGIDQKMLNLIRHWEAKADLKPYFEAHSLDYSKMSDLDVMRRHLQEKYSAANLTAEEFDQMFRDEVIDRFKLDPQLYEEKDVKLGGIRLKAEAAGPRGEMMKKQNELLTSPPPEPEVPQELIDFRETERIGEEARKAYTDLIGANPDIKQAIQSQIIKFGDGEEAFNYKLDNPSKTFSMLTDSDEWASKVWNEDRTPKIQEQMYMAAFMDNPKRFLEQYAAHHQNLGKAKAIAPLENASSPSTMTTASDGKNQNEGDVMSQMARSGRLVPAG